MGLTCRVGLWQMGDNGGRAVQARNTGADQCGYRTHPQQEPAPPHPEMCEQLPKSHPPDLRKGLPREWVAGPPQVQACVAGLWGTGFSAAPRAAHSAHPGPGSVGLNTSARLLRRLGGELLEGRARHSGLLCPPCAREQGLAQEGAQ